MKNNLLSNTVRFKLIIVITLFLCSSFLLAQDSKSILTNAINDVSLKKRGVIKPDETDFRLDYDVKMI